MKYRWISLFFSLFALNYAFSQDLDPKEAKILQNEYGEIVYGNKQFPIIAFFQQDSLKYIYSEQKRKVAILGKNNTILKEIRFSSKDFTIPRFQPYGNGKIILQNCGLDSDYILIEKQTLTAKNRNFLKKSKLIGFKEVENGLFQVHQYFITPSKTLSKVILYNRNKKIDTLYKDTKTRENRSVNVSPRFDLLYFRDKVYFFNADQRIILIFEAQTAKLLQEIDLKLQADEYLKSFMLNFYIDFTTERIYLSGVMGGKTYIWEIKENNFIERYEVPFQIYLIHQICNDKIYFSLQAEKDGLYVYERKFR
jgi:hypothetical protein